jgi:hypothetical protein
MAVVLRQLSSYPGRESPALHLRQDQLGTSPLSTRLFIFDAFNTLSGAVDKTIFRRGWGVLARGGTVLKSPWLLSAEFSLVE